MGLFSALGSIFGGGAAKKASRQAEAAQTAAMQQALAENRRQFDLTREDFGGFRLAGNDALSDMRGLVGLDGNDVQAEAISGLEASPLFQSLMRNGQESLLQSAAATGGLRGGNLQRGLADFSADTLAQTIQQQLANYGGIANMGLGATSTGAGIGTAISGDIADNLTGQGAVRANGLLTRGGITAGQWNAAGGFLDEATKGPGNIFAKIGKLF